MIGAVLGLVVTGFIWLHATEKYVNVNYGALDSLGRRCAVYGFPAAFRFSGDYEFSKDEKEAVYRAAYKVSERFEEWIEEAATAVNRHGQEKYDEIYAYAWHPFNPGGKTFVYTGMTPGEILFKLGKPRAAGYDRYFPIPRLRGVIGDYNLGEKYPKDGAIRVTVEKVPAHHPQGAVGTYAASDVFAVYPGRILLYEPGLQKEAARHSMRYLAALEAVAAHEFMHIFFMALPGRRVPGTRTQTTKARLCIRPAILRIISIAA